MKGGTLPLNFHPLPYVSLSLLPYDFTQLPLLRHSSFFIQYNELSKASDVLFLSVKLDRISNCWMVEVIEVGFFMLLNSSYVNGESSMVGRLFYYRNLWVIDSSCIWSLGSYPNSVFGYPNSIFGYPNSIFGYPNSIFGYPNSVFGYPNSIFGYPNSVFGYPNFIFGYQICFASEFWFLASCNSFAYLVFIMKSYHTWSHQVVVSPNGTLGNVFYGPNSSWKYESRYMDSLGINWGNACILFIYNHWAVRGSD